MTATGKTRALQALRHEQPDRVPVDFVAVPEIWEELERELHPDARAYEPLAEWMEPGRAAILDALKIDYRLLSYDMFCAPPENLVRSDARVDWWGSANRSTPNRMWRQVGEDGLITDIWGVGARRAKTGFGTHENYTAFPLADAEDVADLKAHAWPQPDWWDFREVPRVLDLLQQAAGDVSIRYRVGSMFEVAWQLCGMEKFLMDLYTEPEVPCYIMDRLLEVHLENTRRFLEQARGRVDMIYFYDDVATSRSLMMAPETWEKMIRPRHQQIIDVARAFGVKVMMHSDGAVAPLIPQWIDMGIDVLNPVQTDAAGMEPAMLKARFGDRLTFHGGVNITQTLPRGTPDEVRAEVRHLVDTLGHNGGYIMASSHHIQADTPVANVLAMYEVNLR